MHMALETRPWTRADLDRLPDDGNKYEVVRGSLFVTPPPSVQHENILALLARVLVPYVERWRLGGVFHPRAVIRHSSSEAEPDLMVRAIADPAERDWLRLPLPELVVEVVSESTRLRDYNQKREWYLDLGIPEYWIVDGHRREITIVRPGVEDVVANTEWQWHAHGAEQPLLVNVERLFREAIGHYGAASR
jgi:Uma2 family endonuclease